MKNTLYDKIWEDHCIRKNDDNSSLIYIDRHLIHEVTSPQAFDGLDIKKRNIWNKNSILATTDHNVPTINRDKGITDPVSKVQIETLRDNCNKHSIELYDLGNIKQGIVHVIGPELGLTQPGMTLVCGDSHTSTHGALASLAFGIGTSDVEHVLATQCLNLTKEKNFNIIVNNNLRPFITSKDLILYIIGKIGTSGGTGYTIEYTGDGISSLSIESRMTICNMTIEAGAKSGLMSFDETTHDYLKDREFLPDAKYYDQALKYWETLVSDEDVIFDRTETFNAEDVEPQVTWGTSPEMVTSVDGTIPSSDAASNKEEYENTLEYMGLQSGTDIKSIPLDKIFIGSCTNSRIEDLREAAEVIKGEKVASNIKQAIVVPGSGLVKAQAESEGLDKIFTNAGFEWRDPGCSMCLGMNDDFLQPYERCASTSNRNFQGRQGDKGRTHLVSPSMAAIAGIKGHFYNVREFMNEK
ncbi:MAG: 3-isopropylmalate dehydratase large subunit [Gammaproteobacteria bacterium]|nr:3-isopropylmalate dehydratase large subunit [Gammaproteobacteria bacterium]MBL6818708.1 3-isopropylmalate dehydratase large subunit [Gammaproteobacteria bacterium]MBL6899179.1 3-isopropylmalate dehydratase large subunit [Gammaproteobacteria bacterium]